MRQMTGSLRTVAGGGMKNLMARLTTNRFTAAIGGMVVIGVILGANVGTTITAQIVAFRVYKYGLLMMPPGSLRRSWRGASGPDNGARC